jgi:hypothetical protein
MADFTLHFDPQRWAVDLKSEEKLALRLLDILRGRGDGTFHSSDLVFFKYPDSCNVRKIGPTGLFRLYRLDDHCYRVMSLDFGKDTEAVMTAVETIIRWEYGDYLLPNPQRTNPKAELAQRALAS